MAFSITFIKDIVEIKKATCLIFLFLGCRLTIISIGLMMYTYLKSSSSCDKLWTIVDKYIMKNNLYDYEGDLTLAQVKGIKEQVNSCYNPDKKVLKQYGFRAVYSF